MSESFSNNATPKYLGYVYQVLIAIELCFHAKINETVWLECFGDVYDGETSTEVKHHFERTNLTNNSVDFWKTFKNLVTEDTSSFNSLVLHTTANIPENSLFYNWNQLPKTKKYKLLKDQIPTKTISAYYDASIAKFKRNDLLPILEKLTIKSSQLTVKEKWEELVQDRIFAIIPDELKEDAFHWLYGYIHKQAVDDRYNWHIKINDFNFACQLSLSNFTQDRIPFPSIKKNEIDNTNINFLFIEEMAKIKLRKSPIEKAVSDYLRSKKSEIKFLQYEPITMPDILDEYDESVLDEIESVKMKYVDEYCINTSDANKTSRKFYYESINSPHNEIPRVSDTQKYYRNGRIHQNVEKKNFFGDTLRTT